MRICRNFLLVWLLLSCTGLAQQATATYRPWIGPDGQPLPFRNDAEVLDFLATAKIVNEKVLDSGVTAPKKVLLEKNGIRANAVFRYLDEEDPVSKLDPLEIHFRDSYRFEPAAYELSVLLGMSFVPPATFRTVDGRGGSIQIWVEKSMTEEKRVKTHRVAPDSVMWGQQVQLLRLFDALLFNNDRHQNNILITSDDWKIWSIDHTRAFRIRHDIPNEKQLARCDRTVFRLMQELKEPELREHTKGMLRPAQVTAVLKRRDAIVRHYQKLIAERGEEAVLFDLRVAAGEHP